VSEQTEPSPDFLVDELLEPNLAGRPLPEGDVGNGVAGSVEALNRIQKISGLFQFRLEFDLQRQIHGSGIAENHQYMDGGAALPPRS
jgi:hypothetical protein